MLQVSVLRNDPQWAKDRLMLKGFSQPELVDTIISLDDQRKKTQNEFDHNQSQLNQASKQIGALMAKGQTQEAEALKATVAALKTTLDPLKETMQQIEKQLQDSLVLLPNLPGAAVPEGKSAEDNEVVREGGLRKELPANAQPHWDLINQYRLIDFETGAKLPEGASHCI
jgi:seryl-tRNA synthetase